MKYFVFIAFCFVSSLSFSQDYLNTEKFTPIILDGEQAYLEIATGKFHRPNGAVAPKTTAKATEYSSTPTTSSSNTEYVVKQGDTLYSISEKYGLNVDKLMALNGITDASEVAVGRRLKLGEGEVYTLSPSDTETTASATTYTVQKGDTLYSISRKYGLSVNELKRKNGLSSNLIGIGQVLKVN